MYCTEILNVCSLPHSQCSLTGLLMLYRHRMSLFHWPWKRHHLSTLHPPFVCTWLSVFMEVKFQYSMCHCHCWTTSLYRVYFVNALCRHSNWIRCELLLVCAHPHRSARFSPGRGQEETGRLSASSRNVCTPPRRLPPTAYLVATANKIQRTCILIVTTVRT